MQYAAADIGPGGTLAALLAQRGAPPLPLALRIVEEAAAGLAMAHIAGAVHGDVHPGMLWLARNEGKLRVVLVGLGIHPGTTTPGRSTARYCAPERLRRSPGLSPAADVFSLGVMAYEVLAGLPADWTATLLAMAKGGAPSIVSPSIGRPGIEAHVADAILCALSADPAHRWATAGEFAAALAPSAFAPDIVPAQPAVVTADREIAPADEARAAALPRIHLPVPIVTAPRDAAPVDDAQDTGAGSSSAPVPNPDASILAIMDAALAVAAPSVEDDPPATAEPPVGSAYDELPAAAEPSIASIPDAEPAAVEPLIDIPDAEPAAAGPPIASIPDVEPVTAESPIDIPDAEPAAAEPSIAPIASEVPGTAEPQIVLFGELAPQAEKPSIVLVEDDEPAVAASASAESVPEAPPAADVLVAAVPETAPPVAPPAVAAASIAATPAVASAPAPVQPARAHKLTASRTDLADSLYIPPTFGQARTLSVPVSAPAEPVTAAAPPTAEVHAPVPAPALARPIIEARAASVSPSVPDVSEIVLAPAPASAEWSKTSVDDGFAAQAVAADQEQAALDETAPVAPATIIALPFTAEATEMAASDEVEPGPIAVLPMRKSGLSRLGAQPRKSRAGLVAASIAVVVLAGGAMASRAVLVGSPRTPAATQRIASTAAATLSASPSAAQPADPDTDSAITALATVDPATPLTAAEQKRLADEARKQDQLRRDQQRRVDSLRAVQSAARNQPVTAPAVLAAAPAPVVERPAPVVEQRAAVSATAAPAAAPPPAPAPARVDASRVYSASEVDQRPTLRNRADLQRAILRSYPSALENSGIAGAAVVQFVVMPDGRVDRGSIRVVEVSHTAFRLAASAAIAAARFEPARVDGQAVKSEVSVPLTWNPE
ncbi:TonB family protein [Longimicrobium terrae]|uniref:TonB family protein n=1 Tax=Longimicrobium terrae TaxID=1639882 RepID=A0A841H0V4_9BACT|nr:TonB family protein [Longimicrobium terrae]MBB6071586.1 TonB family protein [Longimicrobium terrae]